MKKTILLAMTAISTFASLPAQAATVFAGSWTVDQGPSWSGSPPNGPLAYTGQEAAALLFGGLASDYVISTVDNLVANINNMAWYSVIGYNGNQGDGGSLLAQDYSSKYLGQFYGPTTGYPLASPTAAASAYVSDNARGATFTNYAFRIDAAPGVPEPATWVMMLAGIGAVGAAMRRRSAQPRVTVSFG